MSKEQLVFFNSAKKQGNSGYRMVGFGKIQTHSNFLIELEHFVDACSFPT